MTFDCADPRGAVAVLVRRARATSCHRPPPGFDSWDALLGVAAGRSTATAASACQDPDGAGPRLFFQRVPEGKSAKNRVHLDVRAAPELEGEERMAALDVEAERLVGLGATRVRRVIEELPRCAAGWHRDARTPRATSSASTEAPGLRRAARRAARVEA